MINCLVCRDNIRDGVKFDDVVICFDCYLTLNYEKVIK